jgi:hypothetical protein
VSIPIATKGAAMTRLATGIEGLDDEHAADRSKGKACEPLCRVGLAGLLGRRWGEVQEIAHGRDGLGAIAAGEQAIMADPVKALGQDVRGS